MKKVNKKSLVRLIENLVNRIVDNRMEEDIERRVEERVQKLLPMLVEHEVNRLLREQQGQQKPTTNVNYQSDDVGDTSGNQIADGVIQETDNGMTKQKLRERFRGMIGQSGGGNNRTLNFDSSDVGPNHTPNNAPTAPQVGHEGKPIDASNPNVQAVAQAMSQDFSSKLKDMNERSKRRGGKIN